mmetsp:Transcript_7083/g.10151  ORF Transcript_7083/g.10151 Transcript_7083/m.10151 type:complete len:96 (+) Transcript_7083:35-322(+)
MKTVDGDGHGHGHHHHHIDLNNLTDNKELHRHFRKSRGKDVAYFNNAGKTEIPESVERAGVMALHYESRPWKVVQEVANELQYAPSNDTASDVRR